MKKFHPKSSLALHEALALFEPGDEIVLSPKVYEGDFLLNRAGPISLSGPNDPHDPNLPHTIIKPKNHEAFKVSGDSWTIANIEVRVRLEVESSYNVLSRILVMGSNQDLPGIIIRGYENQVNDMRVRDPRADLDLDSSG